MHFLEKLTVFTILSFVLINVSCARDLDYFSEDFVIEKNCASQEKVITIERENPKHCVDNAIENASLAIDDCKRKLSQGVMRTCMTGTNKSPKVGELLYCHSKTSTICCLHNFTCVDIKQVNEQISVTAARFLKDKDLFLKNLVKMRKFNTCHPIKGLDASKCADECKSLMKTSPLLEYCNKKGGLLKCCVRRDKAFCHECRYCCTLPFCTFTDENGDIKVEGEDILAENKAQDQTIGRNAVYDLRATGTLFKGDDNRCLKPDDSKDPELWDHYDPDDFYEATTKEMLDKAKIQKFDKNFFNFEDPKVLRKFSYPNETDIWTKTYGFDFACRYDAAIESLIRCRVKSSKECIKASKSKFARNCRKDNGLFKCCHGSAWLAVFPEARKHLYKEGLIKRDPSKDGSADNTGILLMTFYCTYRDFTGNIKHRYKSPTINPIGGTIIEPYEETRTRIEFRSIWCGSWNLCLPVRTSFGEKIHSITTKKELCGLERSVIDMKIKELKKKGSIDEDTECTKRDDGVVQTCPNTTMSALKQYMPVEGSIETESECMKRKRPVRICPEKTLNALKQKMMAITPSKMIMFNATKEINDEIKKYLKKEKSKKKKSKKSRKKKSKMSKKKKTKKRAKKKKNNKKKRKRRRRRRRRNKL